MLLEDQLEPVAREIAHFLCQTGGAVGSSWYGYKREEDLIPLVRRRDDTVVYIRASNHEGRFVLSNIRSVDPDPKTIIFHNPIVLKSETKAGDTQELQNNTSAQQSMEFYREWKNGEAEEAAVQAGFAVESTTKIEAGGEASQFKVSQEFKTTVSANWSKQTGRTKDNTVGGRFPLIVPPQTYVRAQLQWEEQVQQRRIECFGAYDFRIEMGRYHQKRKRWTSGSPVAWDSLEHLLAVVEQRGLVGHARYEHYARRNLSPVSLWGIRKARRVQIDRMTPPFMGATNIRVIIQETRAA